MCKSELLDAAEAEKCRKACGKALEGCDKLRTQREREAKLLAASAKAKAQIRNHTPLTAQKQKENAELVAKQVQAAFKRKHSKSP